LTSAGRELLVAEGSPSLFLGYHGQPEATAGDSTTVVLDWRSDAQR
jgi:hypothetical protein